MENKCNVPGFFVACRNADLTTAKDLLKHEDSTSLSTIWERRTCFHVAVIAGDPDLLKEIAAKLPVSEFIDIITKRDKKGDTALHVAVRKNRLDLVKQLVQLGASLSQCESRLDLVKLSVPLDAYLCDCVNNEGKTPLKLAVSLGFREAVEFLFSRTSNALHYIVELNQVKHVQFIIDQKVDLSELINKSYQPTDGGEQHPKKKSLTNASGDGGEESSQSNGDPNNQQDHPIVLIGDTPLHIAARNKYDHMVNLLLNVRGVNKLARNNEDKTPFEIAREVTMYHESFRIIRKLADSRGSSKPFMDCAPQVTHEKRIEARKMVGEAYKARRDAELVVAALLAAMTCAAAFTVPGGFESKKDLKDRGSPNLISLTSFKLFLIFDCIAFFLSLFVCVMWEMSCELTTGDKMLFMTVNGLLVCCSFAFTTYGFMCAVYVMLERKVQTFSWVVLGSLLTITLWAVLAFIHQSVQFSVKRARFHRLCGESSFFDDIVENVWSRAERCGLLNILRSGDDVSQDLITGHAMCCGLRKLLRSDDDVSHDLATGQTTEREVSHNNSPFWSPLNSRSSSPFLNSGSSVSGSQFH
ncbi:hypothetical protein SUGI_0028600 [Cryptomeria japonica]|nr:hypothetical protein SUGI_0028600 [Cryptomeria japonica]